VTLLTRGQLRRLEEQGYIKDFEFVKPCEEEVIQKAAEEDELQKADPMGYAKAEKVRKNKGVDWWN
jgi:hypothetical protein